MLLVTTMWPLCCFSYKLIFMIIQLSLKWSQTQTTAAASISVTFHLFCFATNVLFQIVRIGETQFWLFFSPELCLNSNAQLHHQVHLSHIPVHRRSKWEREGKSEWESEWEREREGERGRGREIEVILPMIQAGPNPYGFVSYQTNMCLITSLSLSLLLNLNNSLSVSVSLFLTHRVFSFSFCSLCFCSLFLVPIDSISLF